MSAGEQDIAFHIKAVRDRTLPPSLGPLHAEFYHGTRTSDDSTHSFTIAKNIHLIPSVAIIDNTLVMTSDLDNSVRSVSKCKSTQVIVKQTYRYAFTPGDKSYLQDSAYSLSIKSYQQIAMRFCKKYACKDGYKLD